VTVKVGESHHAPDQGRRPSYPGVETAQAEPFGFKSIWRAMGPLSTSPTFLLIGISGAITMMGFFAPYTSLAGEKNFKI